MTSHVFGAVWSPSCANFALRKCALDHQDEFSKLAVDTVLHNFYVDDLLKSVSSPKEATQLRNQVTALLKKGGFRLTKWASSSEEVMDAIPTEERCPGYDDDSHSRVLGVLWDRETDHFLFKFVKKDRPHTKRNLLSVLCSVYDPLGFITPYVLKAKILFQTLCRLDVDWDMMMPRDVEAQWEEWLEQLSEVTKLRIPRCVKPITSKTAQLHHFSDASQSAFGAVSYLRVTDEFGDVHSSLLVSKSRLAPIKTTTIPRLELSAAMEATKLDVMLRNELELDLEESVFWTDSMIVLWYLRNQNKRFQTFVANRVATVLQCTSTSQWRYVGTSENPADDVSRGLSAGELVHSERWRQGPPFLRLGEDSWPREPDQMSKLSPELKAEKSVFTVTTTSESRQVISKLLEYFSSWSRLLKSVAWLIRFKQFLRSPKDVLQTKITAEEIRAAEQNVVKLVQQEATTGHLGETRYQKLNPVLDTNGILVVGGRLSKSNLTESAKHPWILPSNHHVTRLLISHYHIAVGHMGVERVLSEIRTRFWIVKGRASVKAELGRCFSCKRMRAQPSVQVMADLPPDRIRPGEPPFTNVGVDYFGPILVKVGRSQVKRWGCVITCLTTRAVYIDVASSLDTDSFLNLLWRFIGRRGMPKIIRSDNGTNFVGANAVLSHAFNQQKINNALLTKGIQWIFNPSAASHMGGVWERMIRTIRRVMISVLKEQTLDDERLRTVLCIAEGIINGRPLTKVSDDAQDESALTPNHLLTLKCVPAVSLISTTQKDLYRRSWRQVQYLADLFWHRWLKEYLPELQERQKWLQPTRNIGVGDLVLVKYESCPRSQWPLGLVVEVFYSEDSYVRSVRVKYHGSLYTRPISKICLLEAA